MPESHDAPVVLVTGAAKRIGARIVETLHESGWRAVIHYHESGTDARALADRLNALREGSAATMALDLLDTARLHELVACAVSTFGRLDALVNNASSFYPTPMASVGEAEWLDLIGTNFKAPLFLAQAAAESLSRTRGAIVNIIDIHAERPLRGYPLYCAAKAGLAGLTRALALELAPMVRVNGVAPGPIKWPDTPQFGAMERAEIVADTLLRRVGEPLDIALAVRYLLVDAPYVTGQTIAVDGGRSAHL